MAKKRRLHRFTTISCTIIIFMRFIKGSELMNESQIHQVNQTNADRIHRNNLTFTDGEHNNSSSHPLHSYSAAPKTTAVHQNESIHMDSAGESSVVSCRLRAIDQQIPSVIKSKVVNDGINLLEYHLVFPNHSSPDPLAPIARHSFQLDVWARASSMHGQTLLSLVFNYGILSLRTLTFGTDFLEVEMEDVPSGCVTRLNETEVVDKLLYLLSRDFQQDVKEISLEGEERICHEVIVDADGCAKFKDECFKKAAADSLEETQSGNFWINFLYMLLMFVRFAVIFFGPLLMTSAIAALAKKSIPYVVKLKEPLRKKVYLHEKQGADSPLRQQKATLDLSDAPYLKFHEAIQNLPIGKAFDAQIKQYDILVNYERLLTENRVPVGLWRSLGRMIFYCKIRNVGPFKSCCDENMFKRCSCVKGEIPWSYFWRKVGVVLMVVCIPFPWYLRLWIFHTYEYAELLARKEATAKLGLNEGLDNNFIHYFTPDHWLFNCIYALYIVCAIILAYMARRSEEGRFWRIVTGSFSDLHSLSWIRVLSMLVDNFIWPFREFGVCGVIVAVFYWPIALPISFFVFLGYILPLTYLIIRMVFYSTRAMKKETSKRKKIHAYRDTKPKDETIQMFETSYQCRKSSSGGSKRTPLNSEDLDNEDTVPPLTETGETEDKYDDDVMIRKPLQPDTESRQSAKRETSVMRLLGQLTASLLCILSLLAVLFLMSECIGCFVEILVFTMMGIIVNAGTLLKYVSLVILVVVYSYDSFNNVEKKYLKLNKAIFNEVKGRIKDLDKVTSLPSYKQEDCGFKAQELNEQGDYETPDDVIEKPSHHWMINDLVLFVDNEDMPRIPKKLFDEVCEIRVAGVPGPVYQGLLFGIRQFLKIALFIFFVFIVVLSFGDVYKISSTNQMLATLAGGFLPVILRQFLEPERPDIEIGTVSFKSKLDEIIKNYKQVWPMYDFVLEPYTEATEEEDTHQEPNADEAAASVAAQDHTKDPTPNIELRPETAEKTLVNESNSLPQTAQKNDKRVGFENAENSKRSEADDSVDLLIIIPKWS